MVSYIIQAWICEGYRGDFVHYISEYADKHKQVTTYL